MTEKIESAVAALKRGELIIVADSPDREAEGDMVGLADYVSAETVNTMITKARGLLCVPMAAPVASRLGLQSMLRNDQDAFGTKFTSSVDSQKTSTGISAFDRATTIRALADGKTTWDDFYHPGHVFPLIAEKGGVLARGGHTEAAVDLAHLAGASPVAYICEIIKKNGRMARQKDLKALAEGIGMPMITIAELAAYLYAHNESVVSLIDEAALPTMFGQFKIKAFQVLDEPQPALVISKGEITGASSLLTRLHSECFTGDVLGSLRCDCGEQLHAALQAIETAQLGAVLYLRQEGRGIGLGNKIRAYHLQDQGLDTVEANEALGFKADERHYGVAAAILHELGVKSVNLMTNNPDKLAQLQKLEVQVDARVPLEMAPNQHDEAYLKTKKTRFNHLLSEV
ncbi:GTP cyclohydrolase II [Secundilactobacillus kimchicus]|nr:GTP cyclohydrolase II [Secundilactobacillus kimchicus]